MRVQRSLFRGSLQRRGGCSSSLYCPLELTDDSFEVFVMSLLRGGRESLRLVITVVFVFVY